MNYILFNYSSASLWFCGGVRTASRSPAKHGKSVDSKCQSEVSWLSVLLTAAQPDSEKRQIKNSENVDRALSNARPLFRLIAQRFCLFFFQTSVFLRSLAAFCIIIVPATNSHPECKAQSQDLDLEARRPCSGPACGEFQSPTPSPKVPPRLFPHCVSKNGPLAPGIVI